MTPSYRTPPRVTTENGCVRRVGVEIEFAGLPVDEAVAIVRDLYGGKDDARSRFEHVVAGTRFGDFRVEIDSKPLLAGAHHRIMDSLGLEDERAHDVVDNAAYRLAQVWIPCEIVAPPLPLHDLPALEELRAGLCAKDARGTRKSVLYGFGLQLNVEAPSRDTGTLLAYLQAFLLLYDWLNAIIDVDVTRRIGPFIQPFPEEYRQRVIDPSYAPDLDELIDDYLAANPTRNRPLDMLPLFATLREEKVAAGARDFDKVKPRPTFHYRLPNCLIDDPAWTFALEWNRWCEVERLADDDGRRRELAGVFAERAAGDLGRRAWIAEVAEAIG
ncbi:MAG: amidoligase family protein [Deltaproteobacteria bacterium]|nr:amidoligase family protein [Deltaproteobacteria bacterium]